jgi:hypothetical protein
MASVKLQKGAKKGEFTETYVSCNPARMPWRELASILAVRETGGRKSALSLRHLDSDSLPETKEFSLWTGGMYSEKAKEVDTVEWKIRLPIAALEESWMQRYEEAIAFADRSRTALYFACAEYAQVMLVDSATRFSEPAERYFWDILASPVNQRLVQNVEASDYLYEWKEAAFAASREAYRRVCPAMNARQMEAFAQGFAKLWVRDDTKKNTDGDTDSGDNGENSHA